MGSGSFFLLGIDAPFLMHLCGPFIVPAVLPCQQSQGRPPQRRPCVTQPVEYHRASDNPQPPFRSSMFDASFGLFCFLAFVGIALVVVIGVFAYLQAEKRKKALAAWAQSRGWRFSPDKDHDMDNAHPELSCLHQGSERYAYNVITGEWKDWGLCAFDYHYETYSTDDKGQRQTHHNYFSAVILDTGLPLKPLTLRSEGFFDKIAQFFGFDDINFESAEFSRNFHVKSPDRKWAFDVIQQSTMEFLLESPRFALEMRGPHLIAWRGSTFDVATFEAALNVLGGVL